MPNDALSNFNNYSDGGSLRSPAGGLETIPIDVNLLGSYSNIYGDITEGISSSTLNNSPRWSDILTSDVDWNAMSATSPKQTTPTFDSDLEPDEDDQYGSAEALLFLNRSTAHHASVPTPGPISIQTLLQSILLADLLKYFQISELVTLSSVSRTFRQFVHEYMLQMFFKHLSITVTTTRRVKWSGAEETDTEHLYPVTPCGTHWPLRKQQLMFFGRRTSDRERAPFQYAQGLFSPSEIVLRLLDPHQNRQYTRPLLPEDINSNHSRFAVFRDVGITPFQCYKTQVSVFYKGLPDESSILYAAAIPISRLKKWFAMSPMELYMAGEASNL